MFAQNIDCGSYKYPQSMFWNKIRKIGMYPCKSQFCYIKLEYKGVYITVEETVGREIFRFAQHPPHTRFDTMGGFFDQYKELLGTLSPCDMVHLSSRSRYVCYPFKPEMCSKFVKYTMNL